MNLGSYLFLTFIGTTVWAGILAYPGQYFKQNYREVSRYLDPISYVIIGGLLLWYLAYRAHN